MRALLVEDNYEKLNIIHKITRDYDNFSLKKVISVQSAIEELNQNTYDLIIIDIQIPDVDGGDINTSGGVELLHQIENFSDIIVPRYIFGLTSNSSDASEHQSVFAKHGWYLFDLNRDTSAWQTILINKIESANDNNNYYHPDVAIITALEDPELDELLKLVQEPIKFVLEGHSYYRFSIKNKSNKKISIVCSSAERMGLSWSASLTTRIINKFSPKYIFMTGICAGVDGRTDLGDIIVGDPVWDWGAGKLSEKSGEKIFLPDPHQLPLNRKLKEGFKLISKDVQFMKSLPLNWSGNDITKIPSLKIAPMACGSSVISTQLAVDEINEDHRKLTAIEMESYGVMAASHAYDIPCVVIKSVCDFGNTKKSDDVQKYSSYTSASVAIDFIKNHLII
ncbi:response regulator [Serratia plymuthica]|uniref:phosphorylase family protein n=1 Tax=Serratia plymuthica TaxID=82996 RepID=UPI002DBBA915|nr:response regulator [Serratia plymuthica]MEB6538929.1 response regulator [Serratia plymuthica]